MGKIHKPVKGSRAYWPKKRAARIFDRFGSQEQAGTGIIQFAGYKAGMTQVKAVDGRKNTPTAGQEVFMPVTVIQAPKLKVWGVRAYRREGGVLRSAGTVWAAQPSKELERAISVPEKTTKTIGALEGLQHISEVRLLCNTMPVWKKTPEVFEISLGGTLQEQWTLAKEKLGKEVAATEVFKEGDWVDVKAVTIGKGTAGVVERFGVRVRSRKSKKKMRHIGNLGPRGPGRVFPGTVAMAGQLGFQTRTEFNKRVLKLGTGLTPAGGWLDFGELKGDYLLVSGSVPGPKKRLIFIRKGIRTHHVHTEPEQVLDVHLYSQQGK